MFCEKCGKELSTLMVNLFNPDGSDGYYTHYINEYDEKAVVIDTFKEWTGYELTDAERVDTIKCPYCRQFPFESTEIQIEEPVTIVCFKSDKEKGTSKIPESERKQYVDTGLLLEKATFMFDEALGYCKCVLVEDFESAVNSKVVEVCRCEQCENFMKYTDDEILGGFSVEDADGVCYMRVVNSENNQFCAVRKEDFCSCGKPKSSKEEH